MLKNRLYENIHFSFNKLTLYVPIGLYLFLIILICSPTSASAIVSDQSVNQTKAIRALIESQLPAPPDGFTWQIHKNAIFLKPVKWNEKTKKSLLKQIPITTYAASPENFSETKMFEMGITSQIISGSANYRKIKAHDMALLYLKQFIDTHKKEEILLFEKEIKNDSQQHIIFRYHDAPSDLKPIIVHKYIISNNTTDSVHIFTFESPTKSWKENWKKYGIPILSKIIVLHNFPAN